MFDDKLRDRHQYLVFCTYLLISFIYCVIYSQCVRARSFYSFESDLKHCNTMKSLNKVIQRTQSLKR